MSRRAARLQDWSIWVFTLTALVVTVLAFAGIIPERIATPMFRRAFVALFGLGLISIVFKLNRGPSWWN